MPNPTPSQIKNALSKLRKGLPLFQEDIFHIAWEFTFAANQYQLLKEIHEHNQPLAECLLIFRKRLRQAAAEDEMKATIDHLILHYIINTDGPVAESEDDDPFDVFDAATRYARTLCVKVRKEEIKGAAVLKVNGKEVLCRRWADVPGLSSAHALRLAGPEINRARYGRNHIIPSVAFGFDPKRLDYRLKNAMILADFSHLVYFEPDYIEEHISHWGYDIFRWIEDDPTDTQVLVAGKDDHLIITFRGTSNGRDALVDLNFFKTDAPGGNGRVHRGFQQSLDGVWDELLAVIDELGRGKKLFISGHSLGGALGQLAAFGFALKGFPVAGVYVFGSPRVGNQTFKAAYNALLETVTFLHINNEDIVPQIPPQVFGFHDLGMTPRKFDRSYTISGAEIILEDDGNELDFDHLDTDKMEEVQQTLTSVQIAMKATTQFLNTSSQQFNDTVYATGFESGSVDDHCMDQYLFKFGCAILDYEWQRLEQKSRESTSPP